jgi:hypothetical protein
MTFPQQQGPRPGLPPGGFRPQPPLGGGAQTQAQPPFDGGAQSQAQAQSPAHGGEEGSGTGHPAIDAVLQSLANAARLAPGEQIAEYEAAHQVLQETLAGIDR